MTDARTFVFGTLAQNQTVFFEAVGDALEAQGYRCAYLCFHERSHEYLAARGKRSFNAFRDGQAYGARIELSAYPWPSLDQVLRHEKAAFEIEDDAPLLAKLRRYLAACEHAFDQAGAQAILVQELGGFISNVASFYVARRRGIENIFSEPSFYRGRIFFTRNTFSAPQVPGPRASVVSREVDRYLDQAVARQEVVIPVKDARHYRGPIRKLLDARNLRRLAQKTVDKVVLGKKEEFAHIGGHVRRHLRMFVNSRILAAHYRSLPVSEQFLYYPLHVPADVALTVRAPQFVDQYALIDALARAAPPTLKLLIKEHPALVGAVDRARTLALLQAHQNLWLLNPGINNYEVLKRADAVITVNSKSGAEALLLGRPVIVLGDAFYRPSDLVNRVPEPSQLQEALATVVHPLDQGRVRSYFQDVWDASWPGELHLATRANAEAFAASLLTYLG